MQRRALFLTIAVFVIVATSGSAIIFGYRALSPEQLDVSNYELKLVLKEGDLSYYCEEAVTVWSNGSMQHSYEIIGNASTIASTITRANISSERTSGLVLALSDEGFFRMSKYYRDFAYPPSNPAGYFDVTTMNITMPQGTTSVSFERNAMIGLLPESYSLIRNLIFEADSQDHLHNLSLLVDCQTNADSSVVTITGSLVNDGDSAFSGLFADSPWSLAIVFENGTSIASYPTHNGADGRFNVTPHSKAILEPFEWNPQNYPRGKYIVMASMVGFNGGICSYTLLRIQ